MSHSSLFGHTQAQAIPSEGKLQFLITQPSRNPTWRRGTSKACREMLYHVLVISAGEGWGSEDVFISDKFLVFCLLYLLPKLNLVLLTTHRTWSHPYRVRISHQGQGNPRGPHWGVGHCGNMADSQAERRRKAESAFCWPAEAKRNLVPNLGMYLCHFLSARTSEDTGMFSGVGFRVTWRDGDLRYSRKKPHTFWRPSALSVAPWISEWSYLLWNSSAWSTTIIRYNSHNIVPF